MNIQLICVEERDFDATSIQIKNILDEIKNNFAIRFEKVKVTLKKEVRVIEVNRLLLSLCVIQLRYILPEEEYDLSFDDFLPDNIPFDKVSSIIESYFNETNEFIHNIKLTDILEDFYDVNAKVLTTIADVAWSINLYKGNTIDVYDMLKLCHNNKEIKDICSYQTKMSDNIQFADIESAADVQTKKLISLLRSDKYKSCYRNILGSVSPKQFQQVFVNISLKPDLFGIIIPEPINTNFYAGLRNVQDYFIDAVGARKALITNA